MSNTDLSLSNLLSLLQSEGPALHRLISFVTDHDDFDMFEKGILELLYDPAYTFEQRLNLLKAIIVSEPFFEETLSVLLNDFSQRKFENYFLPEDRLFVKDITKKKLKTLSEPMQILILNLYLPVYKSLSTDGQPLQDKRNDVITSMLDGRCEKMVADIKTEIPMFDSEQETFDGYARRQKRLRFRKRQLVKYIYYF